MALSLDHLGLVGGDGSALRAQFSRLGFQLTAEEELQRGDAAAERSLLGQRSCHAVLGQGYVELSEVYSRDPQHHLAVYLRRGPGLHILALGAADIAAARLRCETAGIPCSAVSWATREIRYGERRGVARFEWFMVRPEAWPEGLLCFVRNHTPELVYQPQVMEHPNGALALRALIVACRDPAASARRYGQLLGLPGTQDGEDVVLQLDGGALVLRDMQHCARAYGTAPDAPQNYFAAARISVRDLAPAARFLEANSVPYVTQGGRLQIGAGAVCGAGLELVPP